LSKQYYEYNYDHFMVAYLWLYLVGEWEVVCRFLSH